MLMALGEPLPKKVFGHPWLLFGSDKMSKSKGNVIYADDLVRHFGVDAVRYYVLREMPFAQDGTITYETIIARFNADLANTLGNLVNRTVAMANKYFGGAVSYKNVCADCDAEFRDTAISARKTVEEKMMEYRVADALEEIISLARRSNKYIDETEPWALAKDEEKRDRLETVLFNLLESIRFIGTLLAPFMPETADKIMAQIGSDKCEISDLTVFAESGDKKVGVAEPLFARIDEAKKLEELAAENEPPKKEVAPYKDEIKFDDFEKIDLRVAKVVECEPVKKSDKLLRLMVDTGEATRQIVSGIAKEYKPEELIGKKVILVSNLAPAKLRGVESNGMLLAADMPDGGCKVIFIDDSVEEGSQIH